ncbi:MAG: DUF6760 family protein [Acidobacteriota bacterium]
MPGRVRTGARRGGAWRYPLDRLYEEVAYIAFHFHWPRDQILGLEHRERQRWVAEIAKINQRFNEQMSRSDS